ncbi:thiamine phosphate synthase [Halomarina litorea]|uniref:thiamine phosphate synthase n=1 Tax=Halomarina litorea TaxID=2961595 RepID=UPI0020C463D4|nr:thiamine phosphate synthase [Halomarina sp. BCD28]
MNQPDYGVYLVTQETLSAGRSTTDVVGAALAGGVDVVQLREKDATARERYQLGLELRELTAEAGVPLVVNDRVDLAQAVDADGVHLGEEDLPVAVARELLGPDAIVGRSVSSVDAAENAVAAGADHLGVGAIYATGSKDVADEDAEIGLDALRAIADAVDVPIVAIGGVTVENAREVVEAGADGVAVISAITGADDPEAATRALGREVRGVADVQ